jgi:hypothetical protein
MAVNGGFSRAAIRAGLYVAEAGTVSAHCTWLVTESRYAAASTGRENQTAMATPAASVAAAPQYRARRDPRRCSASSALEIRFRRGVTSTGESSACTSRRFVPLPPRRFRAAVRAAFQMVQHAMVGLDQQLVAEVRIQAPENLGPGVNSPAVEVDSYVAPDQSFVVFAGFGRPDDLGNGDLYVSEQINGVWSPARHLGAGINSIAREYCPGASPDGKYFFFTSFRGFGEKVPDQPWTFRDLRNGFQSVLNGWGNIYQVDMSALGVGKK